MSYKSTLFLIFLLVSYTFETAQCQWYPETCDVNGGMNSISMWNNTTGWIGGENGICKYDGNGNWDLINSLNVRGLAIIDSLNGWAAGHGVYKTNDGGYSWTQVYDNNYLTGTGPISAFDSLHCWAVCSYYDPEFGDGVDLIFTDDGGMTWKDPPDNVPVSKPLFIDPNHGWCLNDHVTYITNDGGNSFQAYYDTLPTGDFYHTYDFYFIDTIRGWKISGYNAQNCGFISSTVDGGRNWALQYIVNEEYVFRAIYFPDSLYGYVTGYKSHYDSVFILKTLDGGLTWEEQLYFSEGSGASQDIFFTDSITGWIVGGSGGGQLILHTDNSGIGTGGISDQTEMIDEGLTLKVSPNPCSNQTELIIGTDSEIMLTLNLYSFNGDRKTIFTNRGFSAGRHSYSLNTDLLRSGIYLVTISGDGVSASSKLVVFK